MAAQHPSMAPAKLFRDEAKTASVQCPACGGPITRKGFGAVEKVVCPYCGSELSPEDNGALRLLQQVARQRRPSVLPLQARGTLDGIAWEIIGIVWRECEVDGVIYPWQEFLLFNPYKGYRWLVFSMSDGHWTLGEALLGAPRVDKGFGHKSVTFKKAKYKHFQTVLARTTYVEGEFPWQVHVGDQAVAHEYVAPPRSISIEESHGSMGEGQDVNFTGMQYITGAEVVQAFKLPGSPPPVSGVAPTQPNPWKKGRGLTLISMVVLLGLWLVAAIVYIEGRENRTVFDEKGLTLEPQSREVQIGEPGEPTTLEVDMRAYPLSNSWAYTDVMLISQEREEAFGLGLTAEEWHGVDGGESWREGDANPSTIVGGVEGGKYLLQIVPQGGDQTSLPPSADLRFDLRIREDVVLVRYLIIPLLIIGAFPILFFLLSATFEGRRWSNSDYAGSS